MSGFGSGCKANRARATTPANSPNLLTLQGPLKRKRGHASPAHTIHRTLRQPTSLLPSFIITPDTRSHTELDFTFSRRGPTAQLLQLDVAAFRRGVLQWPGSRDVRLRLSYRGADSLVAFADGAEHEEASDVATPTMRVRLQQTRPGHAPPSLGLSSRDASGRL